MKSALKIEVMTFQESTVVAVALLTSLNIGYVVWVRKLHLITQKWASAGYRNWEMAAVRGVMAE